MRPDKLYELLLRWALPAGDLLRGTPIARELAWLETTQWEPPERLKEIQDRKLRRLIELAYESVPYYHQLMEDRRLRPSDIRGTSDLWKLPLLTSDALYTAKASLLLNRRYRLGSLIPVRTSGSTGVPKRFYMSRSANTAARAGFYRFLRWYGGERCEMRFVVWGRPVVTSRWALRKRDWRLRFVSRETHLSTWEMSPRRMEAFLNAIRRYGPAVLRGYTSGLVRLANYVEEHKLEAPSLKAVNTTAEALSPAERRILETNFRTRAFDQYGCGECNSIASECEHHVGLHIAVEHCVIEVLDDDDHPVPPGQTGRVIVTDLDNDAFPFIRYDTGDQAALLAEPCSCGRGLPLMSAVSGRTADTIYGLNGNRVWGWFFAAILMQSGLTDELRIREFRFTQTAADHLDFDLVSAREPTPAQLDLVFERIRAHLGPMSIRYRRVAALDASASGKKRYAVRTWEPPPSRVLTSQE